MIFFNLFFLLLLGKFSEQKPAPDDTEIFLSKLKIAARHADRPLPEAVVAVANSMVGLPYVSGTLDRSDEENLVVNLREMDCWTLVENSIAIALTARDGAAAANFQNFQNHLQKLRYRRGLVDGYGSRLHYFSEWILQASEAGLVEDVTHSCGGVEYRKRVSFMSDYPSAYPKLLFKNDNLQKVKAGEACVNAHRWYFIPKKQVAIFEKNLREGDIVVFTSTLRNLDIEHQGFAVRRGGRWHVLHASSVVGRVVVSARPLAEYILRNKKQSGMMVVRFR